MNINTIGTTNSVNALSLLGGAESPNAQQTSPVDGATEAASAQVSKPAEMMAKLSQLLQQDPAKFKQLTQQIADELKSSAGSATGAQAQFLTKLSDNFAQASTSGSLSPLQPRSGEGAAKSGSHHHHGGGHHAGGAGASSAGSAMDGVLSSALDAVNRALQGSESSAAT